MGECEWMHECSFIKQFEERSPATMAIFRQNYCDGDVSQCARYMIFDRIGADAVPTNLYPNEAWQAEQIIGNE